ncbi:MAG: helix-turn-helix transcriptional regulator [Planctomycetes bacterium]|nr:helix-turn-helix transcriptional regulator [Planctomycetota bacterium]
MSKILAPTLPPDLRTLHGANVRRLMARLDMTLQDVVEATGLNPRTLRCILQGVTSPHARTLHKLAEGLGVSTDELFQDPYQSGLSPFDQATNPAVAEVVDAHPGTFARWTPTDFEELFSRMAVGGELTEEGTLTAAKAMNVRRQLMLEVAVILESSEAHLMHDFVGWLYRRVTTID